MKIQPLKLAIGTTLAIALTCGSAAAEISKSVRKEIKGKIADKVVYARIDLPHKSGRHAFGTYKAPLVEITPDGTDTDATEGVRASAFHADSTYWGTMPNAKLRVSDVDFDEGLIEVELEGVDNDEEGTVVLFKEVESAADFDKAWASAFSDVPLQEEHDDWSPEIKKAIAERRLEEGMSKRQAYYVVGWPESFEKTEKDGKEVEIWHTRQDRGMKMGFWYSHSDGPAEIPGVLEFVDGSLTKIEAHEKAKVSLDD